MFLYSAALLVGLVVAAPWWLLRMMTTERYREGLGQRLGRVPAALREVVRGRRVVWVHAVSVGEVLAATRLVAELERELGLGLEWRVVVSTTTRTGQALARERFGTERVFYFPLDFAWAVRAYLRVLRPGMLVLVESELWPRMLHECRRAGVPVAVVNARVSDRSFSRGLRVRRVWGRALRMVSLWLAQSEEDARRLVAIGASPESVQVSGNLKFDVRAAGTSVVAERIRDVAAGRPVVVAGSTVGGLKASAPGEEELVIQAWEGETCVAMKALLVIAPRHPERFAEAEAVAMEFRLVKASDWCANPTHNDEAVMRGAPGSFRESGETQIPFGNDKQKSGAVEIVLLDTIGDLAAVYGVADVAFVGGSLVDRGGHNPLEPAQFGVPVAMGSHYQNFRGIMEAMQAHDAIRIVSDTVELRDTLQELLRDRERALAMGQRGRQVFESQQGATGRTVAALMAMIAETGARGEARE